MIVKNTICELCSDENNWLETTAKILDEKFPRERAKLRMGLGRKLLDPNCDYFKFVEASFQKKSVPCISFLIGHTEVNVCKSCLNKMLEIL